jgi:hypothetical protein
MDRKNVGHEAIKKQNIIIRQSMVKYIPDADKYTKLELCCRCPYKSKKCFKCKVASDYTDYVIFRALLESAKWN